MVWSEHSNVIVMITKLWEKGRPKCEPYFPQDDEPVVYGEFEVSVSRLIQRDGYIIRELTVKVSFVQIVICFFYFLLYAMFISKAMLTI